MSWRCSPARRTTPARLQPVRNGWPALSCPFVQSHRSPQHLAYGWLPRRMFDLRSSKTAMRAAARRSLNGTARLSGDASCRTATAQRELPHRRYSARPHRFLPSLISPRNRCRPEDTLLLRIDSLSCSSRRRGFPAASNLGPEAKHTLGER